MTAGRKNGQVRNVQASSLTLIVRNIRHAKAIRRSNGAAVL